MPILDIKKSIFRYQEIDFMISKYEMGLISWYKLEPQGALIAHLSTMSTSVIS